VIGSLLGGDIEVEASLYDCAHRDGGDEKSKGFNAESTEVEALRTLRSKQKRTEKKTERKTKVGGNEG